MCTQCGAALLPNPTAAQTMLGFQSPLAPKPQPSQPPAQPPVAQPAPPTQPPAQGQPFAAKTMLGFSLPPEMHALQQQFQQQAAPAQPAAQPPPQQGGGMAKTMLGMAMPGVAPVQSQPAQAPPPPAPQLPRGVGSGTILGVAVPGIAPLQSQPGAPPAAMAQRTLIHEPLPAIVPAPAPFMPEAAPSAPRLPGHKGFPIAIVAVIVGVVVLGGGVLLLLLSHSAPPIAATAKVSAEGKEQLHLQCESCADGTIVTWNGAKATFVKKSADLDLPAPLSIGENTFDLAIDRPGHGRDETVKLVLPLAFRIRGDVDGIAEDPPVIRVRIEAQSGSSVSVDGKPVTLDGDGKATLSYDVSQETTGEAEETRTIERKLPYEVTGKDKKTSSGEVVIRVGVVPLRLDAPGPALVTDTSPVWVAGRTAKGAQVTVGATALPVAPDGSFEGSVDVSPGVQTLTVRASASKDAPVKVAPRTVTASVERVDSLAAKATALGSTSLTTFSGSVVDVRGAHHHTILLIDDRSCSSPPCLERVDYGSDTDVQPGDHVTAWGTPGKPVTTTDGKTLPVIAAELVRKEAPHHR